MNNGTDGEANSPVEAADDATAAELVATALEQTLNPGDVDAVYRFNAASVDFYPSSDEHLGREGLEEVTNMFLKAFPDLEVTIEEAFTDESDDSIAVVRYSVEGTHTGTFETIPPTDRQMEAEGICHATVEDGEITRFNLVFDNLGMLEDLGLIH